MSFAAELTLCICVVCFCVTDFVSWIMYFNVYVTLCKLWCTIINVNIIIV